MISHSPYAEYIIFQTYRQAHTARGGHAHLDLEPVIFAISGSFKLICDGGLVRNEHILKNNFSVIYIKCLVWWKMEVFQQMPFA
jgi:hypothetical protein